MKTLRNLLNNAKPHFQEGGKFAKLQSVFNGFESFLFTPNTTSGKVGSHIHDGIDLKRTMIIVVVALIPALLFGIFNVGYQHFLAIGQPDATFVDKFIYGLLAVLPRIVVSYVVGLGIEFVAAQIRGHEIQEGFLVTGLLIPLICPINTPLWMIAVATAVAVIFAKEVFGGTGMNILNVALITRAVLFFGYPSKMSGDAAFVATDPIFGFGAGTVSEAFSGATPLGQATVAGQELHLTNIINEPISLLDSFIGLIPGSVGETSTLCILIGAVILLATGIASWRIMLSVFAGGLFMSYIANTFASPMFPASAIDPLEQICLGGFAFAAVFMATDPVTGARTNTGKYIYGFLIGVLAILIRIYNGGYPEGAMLAVLFMNAFAPTIDYCVVNSNINRRLKRAKK